MPKRPARQPAVTKKPTRRRRSVKVPNNLPSSLGPLVGRQDELSSITALLGRDPLVTLTGGPGIGKTRLAIETAARVAVDFPDGVWFAPLASITDGDAVVQAVRSAVPVREQQGRDAIESLVAGIGDRQMLLVLDNCEHLVPACAALASTLLGECPHLRILATSQEPLAVARERTWPVPALTLVSTDDAEEGPGANAPAVRLFALRATAADPGFALTAELVPAVVEICQRLDGNPLAIELAAARVPTFSPGEIARRLDDRFGFLTQGGDSDLARHQTLRTAVDWSYDLLTDPERTLLARLSVFAGGCTLEMVEEVCAGGLVDGDGCLARITGLVAKSLVCAEAGPDGTRYRMFETIRDYGRDRLVEAEEASSLADRHLRSCVSLAERAEPELNGPDQRLWLTRLEDDYDNVRAAVQWSLAQERAEEGLRIVGSLTLFWRIRGRFTEGTDWLEKVLTASAGTPSTARPGRCGAAA